ncbi:helix-turn-helix transcriptional regulator [Erysipelothrix enhydrae]|uniref:helix-turn-helix domain-containing protein n=1 Tax=Erysipelothrix enhydrae TaxID=2890314 RepID=UPI002B247FC8|nr:helix-turn-helix transcriptional regulator [Erysipelothrix sp. 4322-04]WRB87650.1 helix-turn-helix transcriptional regulator [Erysipelothrix sp. 4322-04]
MLGTLLRNDRLNQNMSQQALCEGICSISYLSKIESNTVTPSEEILYLLFDCLGINLVQDQSKIEMFTNGYNSFWNDYLAYTTPLISKELKSLATLCLYSNETINAHLLLYYSTNDDQYLNRLKDFEPMFSVDQRLAYTLAFSETLTSENKIHYLLQTTGIDKYGIIHQELGITYYITGLYYSAIETLSQAYKFFSKQGNVKGMYLSSFTMGSSYANLTYTSPDQLEMMEFYYNRGLKLNRYLEEPNASSSINYNLGATYLLIGDYTKAQLHLTRAYENVQTEGTQFQELNTLILQKLCLLNILQNQRDLAHNHFSKLDEPTDRLSKNVYDLLEFMLERPGYIHEKEYEDILILCKDTANLQAHHGYVLMYVKFLIQYYKANRLYKKALNLTSEYKIS